MTAGEEMDRMEEYKAVKEFFKYDIMLLIYIHMSIYMYTSLGRLIQSSVIQQ